jgi:NADH:ubiquinone oxidoreductase subunit 3 (subunit A)
MKTSFVHTDVELAHKRPRLPIHQANRRKESIFESILVPIHQANRTKIQIFFILFLIFCKKIFGPKRMSSGLDVHFHESIGQFNR